MAYGVKYYGEFDSFKDDPCVYFIVQILQKDYTGGTTEILLSGVPAVQEWQDDERNKPIKGSTLKVGIINNGIVSLESFYSDYDDEYQVVLRQRSTDAILFTGYIIQDECTEILADFAHEIVLTATDMLGTLKDITLGQAAEQYGDLTTYTSIALSALDSVTLRTMDSRVAVLKPNQKFTIDNGIYQGSYTLLAINYNSILGWELWTSPSGFTPFTSDTCDMTWRTPTNLLTYISLGKILRLCLQSTKLELGTKAIGTLYDIDGDTERWLDSTCLMGNTFLNNGSWMSCYDVAEAILSRFRATLFQSKGFWWIMRYNEVFIGNLAPAAQSYLYGYQYDAEMDYQTDITITDAYLSFNLNEMEFGTTKSIERPVGYIKDTFQYQQPDSLLKNPNLEELGSLVEVNSSGSGTSLHTDYEYNLPYWSVEYITGGTPPPQPYGKIRIVKDYQDFEIERYIAWPFVSNFYVLQSNDILLSKGDVLTFSFSFRTESSHTIVLATDQKFQIIINDGINPQKYIDQDGLWTSSSNYGITYNFGDQPSDWHNVTITSTEIPYDCICNLRLTSSVFSDKLYYKDLDFKVKHYVNESGYTIGHNNIYNNLIPLNNISEKDISIDTSPSAAISGTLFLDNSTGIIRNKSRLWSYPGGIYGGSAVLGKKILMEELFIKYKARYKYEGNLLTIFVPFPGDYIIGPETIINYSNDVSNPIRLVFGKLSIDYKQGMADCNMFFIANKDEDILDINDGYVYEFNYLYENN